MLTVDSPEVRLLLDLLANELFDVPCPARPEQVDWELFLGLAKKHAVLPLVFGPLKRLGGVPNDILAQTRVAAAFAAVQLEKYLPVQQRAVDCCTAGGIPCAVIKGLSVASCYPHPELRPSGDIDILVPQERLGEAVRLLEASGCVHEEDFDMHVSLMCEDICLEIHPKVSHYPDNDKGRFAKATMEGALAHVGTCRLNGYAFPVLEDAWQALALLSHMERHLVMGGIGLKQLCDWAISLRAMAATEGFVDLIRKCGLATFAWVATSACRRYLGYPGDNPFGGSGPGAGDAPSMDCPPELVRDAMNDMIRTGNCHDQSPEQRFGAIFSGAYDESEKSWVRNYLSFVKRRISNAYPWAKSPAWVAVFAVYLPILQLAQVIRGRSTLANPIGMMREAGARDRLLKSMGLYR